MREMQRCRERWLVVVAAGVLVLTAGCDPTLQATVEDGIISLSTSFFGALLRAILELGAEAQEAKGTAAALLADAAGRIFA